MHREPLHEHEKDEGKNDRDMTADDRIRHEVRVTPDLTNS